MAQYPVKVNYSFDVDLDIAETQLSSVKTSILTNNIIEEEIDFNIYPEVNHYQDTFYVYGDGALLAIGGQIDGWHTSYGWWRGYGSSTFSEGNEWRFKYVTRAVSEYIYDLAYWLPIGSSPNYRIRWTNKISCPKSSKVYHNDPPNYEIKLGEDYIIMPYSTITIKRNTGLTISEAEALNPNWSIPPNTTFPHMKLRIPNMLTADAHGLDGNPVNRQGSKWINESKLWIKLGKEKYRLKVKGYFFKWTDKQTRLDTDYYTDTYTVGTYNFIPYYKPPYLSGYNNEYTSYDSYYIPAGHTETTGNKIIVQEAIYNPIDIKLLVNYVNNRGHNEVRNYTQ